MIKINEFFGFFQIWEGITTQIIQSLVSSPADIECLRCYLTLPLYHEFINSKNYEKLHTPFSRAVLNLTKISKNILKSWWAEQSIDYFERLVGNYKEVVLHILTFKFAKNNSNSTEAELPSVTYEPNLEAALKLLEMLYDINMNQRKQRLSYETFYLPDIADMVNLQNDFYRWSQGHVSRVYQFPNSFCPRFGRRSHIYA